jgi:hypothetical protein
VFAVLVVVLAVMQLYAIGFMAAVRDSAAALQTGTRISAVEMAALALLALAYPIVDLVNWQRLAAFARDGSSDRALPERRSAALRRLLTTYAAETALLWLFGSMFGALAALATAASGGGDAVQDFIRKLASQENYVAAAALSLFLVGLFAMALSTMSSAVCASLAALRYDLPPAAGAGRPGDERKARRRALSALGVFYALALGALYLMDAHARFGGSALLPLFAAFACAQLSFAPLVLGPALGGTGRRFAAVNPAWYLGLGATLSIAAVAAYLATGNAQWAWAAVLGSVGAGAVGLALARLRLRGRARP